MSCHVRIASQIQKSYAIVLRDVSKGLIFACLWLKGLNVLVLQAFSMNMMQKHANKSTS